MRPSQGRVPLWPTGDVWVNQLGTEGPMARNVADLAALLHTQAGFDARTPLSLASGLPEEGPGLLGAPRSLKGLRVAWLGDLGGHLATDPGMLDGMTHALERMAGAGAEVEAVRHGFDADAVWNAWLVWRGALVAPRVAAALKRPNARAEIKPEALWEYEQAQTFSLMDFMHASEVRSMLYAQLCSLLSRYDVLALPVAQVWPFPIAQRWPQTVDGRPMDTYHRWMESTLYATFAGLPALSMPAGFHPNGRWPAGLQLIGRPQGDADLLAIAAGYEGLIGDWLGMRPAEPVSD
jgi:amidase